MSVSSTAPSTADAPAHVPVAGPEAAAAPSTGSSKKLVTLACMLVMVLASMETTITSTAMPTIIGELHGLNHYAWVASLFLLTSTIAMPLYGRLADSLGRKRVLLFAITLFLLASLLASTATSIWQLIAWRGVQGLGAGGIMPIVLTVLGDIFTLEQRARIQGAFSAIWGTASLAGPALGALLVETLGWRSIFYVNLPPGLIAMAVLWLYYRESRPAPPDTLADNITPSPTPNTRHWATRFDLGGFALLSLATSAVLVAVSLPVSAAVTLPLLLTCAVATALFVRHERRTPEPILPPDLLSRSDIWPSVLASGLLGIGFLSLDTYVPLFVQGGQGGGPRAAAAVVTPVMLAWASSGLLAAPLVVRKGFRFTADCGSLLMSAGFVGLLTCAALAAPAWALTLTLFITGLGLGPTSMACLLSVQNGVEYARRATVTGSIQLARTLGGALGIGLHGALFTFVASRGLTDLQSRGYSPASLLDPHTVRALPPDVLAAARHTIAHSLLFVFASMILFALLQVLTATRVPASRSPKKAKATEALEAMA